MDLASASRYLTIGASRSVPVEPGDGSSVRLASEPRAEASLARPRVSRGWLRYTRDLRDCRALWRAGSLFVTMLRPAA